MAMSGRFLLDTNVVIALFGGDAGVQQRLSQADEFFVSAVALGELYYGAYKSGQSRENQERIDAFARETAILGCDADTAREYGLIKNQLRRKGRPIPENDIWIAATAREGNLVLVTRDEHYSQIEDLKRETW